MKRLGQFIGYIVAMILIGFLAQFQWVGYCMIAIFAVVVLWRRLEARYVFIGALVMLGMTPVALLSSNWLVAENVAAYAFCLFVLGNVMMTIDLRRQIKQKKYNKQRN